MYSWMPFLLCPMITNMGLTILNWIMRRKGVREWPVFWDLVWTLKMTPEEWQGILMKGVHMSLCEMFAFVQFFMFLFQG